LWKDDSGPGCGGYRELFVMALSAFDMGICRGYVALRPLSSYALRAIRIHLLHLYKYTCAPVNLKTITDDYRSIYSDDELTSDVASDIMRSKARIFLDHLVTAIGS